MKKIIVQLIVVCTMILSGCRPLASPTKPPTIAVGAGQLQVYTDGNEIRDLLISGDDLWAATQGGVVRWDMQNGTYQKYTITDGLASDDVYAITQDQQGNIWFATGKGLMRFDGKNWQNLSGNGGFDSNTLISIACDNQDDVVVSAIDASISLFNGKTWQIISPAAPPQSALISGSRQIVVDDSGNIWATVQGRLESYDGKVWDSFTPAEGWDNDTQVLAISKAPDGSIWVATDSGLVRYNGKSFQPVTPNRSNQYIETMAFDNQGILWCTTGNGISRWDGKTWQDFNDGSLTQNSNYIPSRLIYQHFYSIRTDLRCFIRDLNKGIVMSRSG
ncbi:MAG: two-component regulator propeller domain-containing protein [Dehalococcoidales bacterium]